VFWRSPAVLPNWRDCRHSCRRDDRQRKGMWRHVPTWSGDDSFRLSRYAS
jgi:hypothetical protein